MWCNCKRDWLWIRYPLEKLIILLIKNRGRSVFKLGFLLSLLYTADPASSWFFFFRLAPLLDNYNCYNSYTCNYTNNSNILSNTFVLTIGCFFKVIKFWNIPGLKHFTNIHLYLFKKKIMFKYKKYTLQIENFLRFLDRLKITY